MAVLLATALPLLANDLGNAIPENSPAVGEMICNDDEQDTIPETAAQAIHLSIADDSSSAVIGTTTSAKDMHHTDNSEGGDSENDRSSGGRGNKANETHAVEHLIGNSSTLSMQPENDLTKNPQHELAEEILDDEDLKNSWLNVSVEDEVGDNLAVSANPNSSNAVDEMSNENEASSQEEEEETVVDSDISTLAADSTEETRVLASAMDIESTVLDEDDFKLRERVAVDYASKSAGALVIEKSGSFKGTSNLLNGDRDKYAIAPCEENKFVVVSLSEDILVKVIKLANYERFSSTVKEFQVMGSQTMDTWVDLGTYTAKSGNGEQLFELVDPAWARYLKFKFLSHHGLEYYCTYSQIKVHGSTMVQGFHEQWEENEEEEIIVDDSDDDADALVEGEDQSTQNETDSTNSSTRTTNEREGIVADTAIDENLGSDGGLGQGDRGATPNSAGPSVCELAIPTALDAALQGKSLGKSSHFDTNPSLLSNLSQASRESRERQNLTTSLSRIKQFGFSKQVACAGIHPAQKRIYLLAADVSDSICAPKISDTVEMNARQLVNRLSTANTIPRVIYSVPKKLRVKPDYSTEGGDTIDNSATAENGVVEKKREIIAEGDDARTEKLAVMDSQVKEKGNPEPAASYTSTPESIAAEPEKTEEISDPPLVADVSLAKLLEGLPSAECLGKLDFGYFKAKALRKATSGTGASNHVGSMEPIFKKLTDEIKALQTNLSIQDQFTKASVACYQRVLFDLVLEMEKTRKDQDFRLSKLEEELHSSEAFTWRLLYSISSIFSFFYSILFACNSAILGYWVKLCSGVYGAFNSLWALAFKHFIRLWPGVKSTIVSFGSHYPNTLSPLVHHVDNIVQDFDSASRSNQAQPLPENGTAAFAITIPIVPILAALLIYRLFSYLKAHPERQANNGPGPRILPMQVKVPDGKMQREDVSFSTLITEDGVALPDNQANGKHGQNVLAAVRNVPDVSIEREKGEREDVIFPKLVSEDGVEKPDNDANCKPEQNIESAGEMQVPAVSPEKDTYEVENDASPGFIDANGVPYNVKTVGDNLA